MTLPLYTRDYSPQARLDALQTNVLQSPAPETDTDTALARIRLILLFRFRAIFELFMRDPNAHLSHSDFTTLSRVLALNAPNKKHKDAPSPLYIHLQKQSLNILNARLTRFQNERLGESAADPIPTLILRIMSKTARLAHALEPAKSPATESQQQPRGQQGSSPASDSPPDPGHSERSSSASGAKNPSPPSFRAPSPRVGEGQARELASASDSRDARSARGPTAPVANLSTPPSLPATQSQQHPSPIPVHPCSSVEKSSSSSPNLTGQAKRRLKAQLHEQRKRLHQAERLAPLHETKAASIVQAALAAKPAAA